MEDDDVADEDFVSTFLVQTCRFDAQLNPDTFHVRWEAMKDERCTLSGAVSEFYIDPMLSTDSPSARVMRHSRTHLAVTSRDRVPRRLPASFRYGYVSVIEVTDGGFLPGYVLLREVGALKRLFDVDDAMTTAATTTDSSFQTHVYLDGVRVRPVIGDIDDWMLPFSTNRQRIASCIRCLEWPTQAADWPTRRREHNWPDVATVGEVVNSGCDLVSAVHRQADVLSRSIQHRIAFFRAETRLLNCWTPVQQLIYHVLRLVLATEKFKVSLQDDDENDNEIVITNYHLKTMMLWTCEMKSSTWWNQLNVVRRCCDVMNTLVQICESTYCRGYFISDSNLFECGSNESDDDDDGSSTKWRTMISQLKSFTDASFLSEWLVENYIFRCARESPEDLQVLLIDAMTTRRVETVGHSLVKWRRDTESRDRVDNFISLADNACIDYCRSRKTYLDLGIVLRLRREFKVIDDRLDALCASLTCLSLSSKIYFGENALCDDIVDCIAAVLVPYDESNQIPSSDSLNLLRNALRLLQLSSARFESDDEQTSSVLRILSFAYFRRVEWHADVIGDDCLRHLANVYLVVLHFVTGRYQMASSQCRLAAVMPSRGSAFVVEGQCLPKIDDDVDITLGLVTLYKFLVSQPSSSSLTSDARRLTAVFTADLFAAYLRLLNVRVSSDEDVDRCSPSSHPSTLVQYEDAVRASPSLFCTDALLFFLTCESTIGASSTTGRRSGPTSMTSSTQFNSKELGRLLVPLSVNRLTSLRRVVARDSRRPDSFVITDVEAMYAYRCGRYDESYRLSQQNVVSRTGHKLFVLPLDGPAAHVIDNDAASLTALCLIACHSSPPIMAVNQTILTLYLVIQNRLKLGHVISTLLGDLRRIKLEYEAQCETNVANCLLLAFAYRKAIISIRRQTARPTVAQTIPTECLH